jgi:hypothetical protein
MSRDIEYIANVQAYVTLNGTDEFSIQGGFPTNPDEVVIRQITYGHSAGASEMLLIHSNINHGLIGAIGGINGFMSNPGTRIQTRNPLSNVLTFKLMSATFPPMPAGAAVDLDQICISMDFIKYKQPHGVQS